MSSTNSFSRDAARRDVETAALLGVDFVPVKQGVASARPAHDAASVDKRAAMADLRARYERESPLPKKIHGWTNIVFGDGDPDARLMFVGEAPGAEEDRQGRPFVGRSGKLLDTMIEAMGLRRADVYIANILKVRPPDNRTPTMDEAAADGPFLIEQIRLVRPEVIVTLGKPAAQFLLSSNEPMGRLRGAWRTFDGVAVMSTFHPAYLLRQYTKENRQKVWSDLLMVMERLGLSRD